MASSLRMTVERLVPAKCILKTKPPSNVDSVCVSGRRGEGSQGVLPLHMFELVWTVGFRCTVVSRKRAHYGLSARPPVLP